MKGAESINKNMKSLIIRRTSRATNNQLTQQQMATPTQRQTMRPTTADRDRAKNRSTKGGREEVRHQHGKKRKRDFRKTNKEELYRKALYDNVPAIYVAEH